MGEDKEERNEEDLQLTIKLSHKEDPIMILAIKINFVNAINHDQFVYFMQFEIEEPETYV